MMASIKAADELIVRLNEIKCDRTFAAARRAYNSCVLYEHLGYKSGLNWLEALTSLQRLDYDRERASLREALKGKLLRPDATGQVDYLSVLVLEDLARTGFVVEVTFDGLTWEPAQAGVVLDFDPSGDDPSTCKGLRISTTES